MLLDEEAQMNQAATVPPAGAAQPAPAGPRQASQGEQAMLELIVRQAAQFLTSDDAVVYLARAARTEGAEAAVQQAVEQALGGVMQAAGAAGKEVPPDVQAAAQQALLGLVSGMLQAAQAPEGEQDVGAA